MSAAMTAAETAAKRPSLFWQLYQKEIGSMRGLVLFALLSFLTLFIFLWTRLAVWPTQAVTALSIIPLTLLPFWAIWAGFNSLRSEWHEKTVYYWLALPARGTTLLGAKLLALGTAALALYAIAGLGFSYFLWGQEIGPLAPGPQLVWALVEDAVKMSVVVLLNLLLVMALAQLSYAVGQTVHRLRWLASGLTFFGLLWLGGRVSVDLINGLRFLGSLSLWSFASGPYGLRIWSVPAIPVAVPVLLVLATALLFVATAWILEKRAEA